MTRVLSEREAYRDARGLPQVCAGDGLPAGEDPLVIDATGNRVHKSHFDDPQTGWFGCPYTLPDAGEAL